MKSKIIIDSELSWLTVYLKKIRRVIDLNKIESIKSVKYDKRVNRGSYAICRGDGKSFSIDIDKYFQWYTHHHDGSWSVKLIPHTRIDILCLLAHELSHTALWNHDHSPEHKLIEARITAIFMKQLKRENYKDAEDEMKTRSR